jgi:hypothetical protein
MTEFVGRTNSPLRDVLDRNRLNSGLPAFRALLLLAFLLMFFVSLAIVSDVAINFHISNYPKKEGVGAIVAIAAIGIPAALIGSAFIFAPFSFGYLVGFYLFAMMAGYFWVNTFGTLGYDRSTALISATASIIFFLAPTLLIVKPAKRLFTLSHAVFDVIPVGILCLGGLVVLLSAFNEFHLVGLADIYKYRDSLNHSRLFYYFVGNFNGALFPFAFACFFMRKRWLMLLLLCGVALLFYPVTLTKISLFVAFSLVFFAILSSCFEPRAAVILSLLIPAVVGSLASAVDSDITNAVFGFLSLRLLAVPSISLDHHYVYFADHPLTYFCQISLLKTVMSCPYSDQLGDVLANWFRLGSMNASLFAIEGVASVGPLFAPISAFACGLVMALGNRLSAGLPGPFILVSAAALPPILLNVSLTTTMLTHGLGLLFLLWYITPRDYFEEGWLAPSPTIPAAASH